VNKESIKTLLYRIEKLYSAKTEVSKIFTLLIPIFSDFENDLAINNKES